MGIWALHIQAMYEMMPYLAASGHNLYTKCIHVYLQQMHKLHETHPEVSRHFDQGLNIVRRSDRFWAGLSPDLVIEQLSPHAEHEDKWRFNQRSWHDRNPGPRLVDGAPGLR